MKLLDAAEKQRLLDEFKLCLEACENTEDDGVATGDSLDLHTLLSEMAALKNEIRLESRQFKTMLDEMRNFAEVLREQNAKLNRDLEQAREQVSASKQKAERKLLLDMLDLRDRLQAAVNANSNFQPSFMARFASNELRFAKGLSEGLSLTLQRVDDTLAGYKVRAIDVLNKPLDPHMMNAVGIECVADKTDGIVLREARRGFLMGGELLRAAEVIVNKKAE